MEQKFRDISDCNDWWTILSGLAEDVISKEEGELQMKVRRSRAWSSKQSRFEHRAAKGAESIRLTRLSEIGTKSEKSLQDNH